MVKAFSIKPEVIYLKDNRDKLLLLTEKRTKEVPQCDYGYYGGSSPDRKGKYANKHLTDKIREKMGPETYNLEA